MSGIKLFVVDIDGTLTENGNGIIFLPALVYLRNLQKMGFDIIYVTGRSVYEAYVLASFGGTTRLAIGENGGVIMTSPQQILLLADDRKCLEGYNLLINYFPQIEREMVFPRFTEVVLARNFDIIEGQRILDQNNLNLRLSDSKYAIHLNEKGVDKSTGLQKALDVLKINKNEAVAIGDSQTDLALFQYCKYSVALDHSPKDIKSAAKYVTKAREGHGLVEAIDYIMYNWCY